MRSPDGSPLRLALRARLRDAPSGHQHSSSRRGNPLPVRLLFSGQSGLRRPLEPAQYTSIDFTQTLDDHRVLQSIGSVGDALDNALAESFVDSFKTELIADRVWVSFQ